MRERQREKETMREEKKKGNNTSLRDLRRTNGRNASGQETKLAHATRATCGYQKLLVSLPSKKVGVSPTLIISCLVAM